MPTTSGPSSWKSDRQRRRRSGTLVSASRATPTSPAPVFASRPVWNCSTLCQSRPASSNINRRRRGSGGEVRGRGQIRGTTVETGDPVRNVIFVGMDVERGKREKVDKAKEGIITITKTRNQSITALAKVAAQQLCSRALRRLLPHSAIRHCRRATGGRGPDVATRIQPPPFPSDSSRSSTTERHPPSPVWPTVHSDASFPPPWQPPASGSAQ